MKNDLERIDVPGEHEARERTWSVVRAALAERQPLEPRSRRLWPAVAVAVVAAALSPPGQAVVDEIREVVGVERAQPALFSLPAGGRLLVVSDAGIWIVQEDGSKRLLGNYREATWSPLGRFVAATRQNELAALEPDGDVRWTLARRGARSARWTGTATDTRIAYVDRTGIRVVAGDGTGDRLLVPGAQGPLAWRPGERRVLAYASSQEVGVVEVDSGRMLWRVGRVVGPRKEPATAVTWWEDRRLLVLSRESLRLYAPHGSLPYELAQGYAPAQVAAPAPNGRSMAFVRKENGRSQVWIVPRMRANRSAAKRFFGGAGGFGELSWSPDGRWLLVTWPTADQWVFVRANGRGIRAVSNISEQFRSHSFPEVQGWVP